MSDDFKKLADDALSFPVLTEEVNFPGGLGQVGTSSGTAPLGQKVNIALREILGWRPRANDPRGFLASLNQSFEVKEVEGHLYWTWRPRTFAAEADLGAITGAQASIYTRARAALDQSLPLLDGLKPLRADHDLEDIDAARAIVRSSFTELVYELGIEGGPRLARVDGYFLDLLGPIADPKGTTILTNPEEVGGQLALLRDEFGLVGEQVNTIDEEQNQTNFFILVDSINSLWLTWKTQRSFFDHSAGGKAFLGTQFVLLSRNLAVVNESVEETYFAMNSVFLGPAERQVTQVTLAGGEVVFVGEVLDWVQRFATEEGPRLLREGGKDGVINAFRPTLDRLIRLVSGLLEVSAKNSNNPTAGFHTPRVRRSLEELKLNLETTRVNAGRISRLRAPVIRLVEHADVSANDSAKLANLLLTVSGDNFNPSATLSVKLPNQTAPLEPKGYIFLTQTQIRAIFDLTGKLPDNSSAIEGQVIVTNPDGQRDETGAGKGLIIRSAAGTTPAPHITRVQPDQIIITNSAELENFRMTVSGSGFQAGATLALNIQGQKNSVPSKPPEKFTSGEFVASFDLKDKLPHNVPIKGTVIVTNLDKQQAVAELIIAYVPQVGAPPNITRVTPVPGTITDKGQLENLQLEIEGSGFQQGAKVSLKIQGKDEEVNPKDKVSVESPTHIKAAFNLKKIVTQTTKEIRGTVIVTNPGGLQGKYESLIIHYRPGSGEGTTVKPNLQG